MKNNEKLNSLITSMINAVDKKIENEEIYFNIIESLNSIFNKRKLIINYDENSIQIKENKKNKEAFKIKFEPNVENFNKLIIKSTYWNGRKTEVTEIQYINNAIIVKNNILTKCVYSGTNKISEIESKLSKKIYVDNIQVYDYKYESLLSSKDSYNKRRSLEEETYVSEKKAVVKRNEIKEDGESCLNYYKTDYYDVPNFDTRKERHYHQYGLSYTTKEDYEQFIKTEENMNEIRKLKEKVFVKSKN